LQPVTKIIILAVAKAAKIAAVPVRKVAVDGKLM
jgi:hypothetical protein